MQTIRVYWKEKFAGKSVVINAADFNVAIHRRAEDGPWQRPAEKPAETAAPSAPPQDAENESPAPKAKKK